MDNEMESQAEHTFLFEESLFQSFCLLDFDDHYRLCVVIVVVFGPTFIGDAQRILSELEKREKLGVLNM